MLALPASTTVTIDGTPNATDVRFHAESYTDAKAEMLIGILVVNDTGQKLTTVRPGRCDEVVPTKNATAELGTMRLERIDVMVFGLGVSFEGFACEGDDHGFSGQP